MTWYLVANGDRIASPALLIYPDRIGENVRRMIELAGGPMRLRPHVKTHKMSEVVRLQQAAGIDKFKCSTIAEAEMVAACGASDVLLAYAPVGPNIDRLLRLVAKFPNTRFSTVSDDADHVDALSAAATGACVELEVLLDIDNGMHRSGIVPGDAAEQVYRRIASSRSLRPGGLHVYDGHLRDSDLAARRLEVERAFAPVDTLRERLLAANLPVPRVVAGGTFSYPIYASRGDIECSPGTTVLWDYSYSTKVPDLEFLHAAMLLTRVVSRPVGNRLCLDLGYKAVSPDNPERRVFFPDLPDARMVNHSEEHLVIETAEASRFALGDALYAIPWHVCPTVALHAEAHVIENGRAVGTWQVVARQRRITI
ncbi:MAG TPA: D-TA family PLP-dependent enzyme [Pirellulales bacterium]|nr:D-TA family PLP-dependent enzyme [Pirellulales bacterium]